MKIGVIGEGAIGRYVVDQLRFRGLEPSALLVRRSDGVPGIGGEPIRVLQVRDLPSGITHMIDCAGHLALAEHGPDILERGVDLITLSLGALADQSLYFQLERSALAGRSRLHLASGAIGALDCLQAARVGGLDTVTYTGRKPPKGWKGSPAEARINLDGLRSATTHFEGSARQAALDYPKNANVAAAVSLAGIGFDDTVVKLIADPAVAANIHEVSATGAFGAFTFHIEGNALPDNPRSSALAAMSVIAAIERQRDIVSL